MNVFNAGHSQGEPIVIDDDDQAELAALRRQVKKLSREKERYRTMYRKMKTKEGAQRPAGYRCEINRTALRTTECARLLAICTLKECGPLLCAKLYKLKERQRAKRLRCYCCGVRREKHPIRDPLRAAMVVEHFVPCTDFTFAGLLSCKEEKDESLDNDEDMNDIAELGHGLNDDEDDERMEDVIKLCSSDEGSKDAEMKD